MQTFPKNLFMILLISTPTRGNLTVLLFSADDAHIYNSNPTFYSCPNIQYSTLNHT